MAIIEVIDRSDDGAGPIVQPSWDTLWEVGVDIGIGGCGDWVFADPETDPNNAGAFAALDPLGTAILIQLGTNKRALDGMGEPQAAGMSGWHGDTFDLDRGAGEDEIGSWLYLLERSALTDETLKLAEYYATEALQCLINQGVADRIECVAEKDNLRGWLIISVQIYIPAKNEPYEIEYAAFPLYGAQ